MSSEQALDHIRSWRSRTPTNWYGNKWLDAAIAALITPIPMVLHCPKCGLQHVDAPAPDKDWTNPPHKSHLCHGCGLVWRPADVATTGVASITSAGKDDTWTPTDPGLRDALLVVLPLLQAWDAWEGGIILDNDCWPGAFPVISQVHLDALIPLQERRNEVREALRKLLGE